jgi:three-Cys-motif partner protein
MEVEWSTIKAIASTKAIDLWLLFPLGVAVNRLLRCDGQIDESVKKKLDRFFGTTDWFDQFY